MTEIGAEMPEVVSTMPTTTTTTTETNNSDSSALNESTNCVPAKCIVEKTKGENNEEEETEAAAAAAAVMEMNASPAADSTNKDDGADANAELSSSSLPLNEKTVAADKVADTNSKPNDVNDFAEVASAADVTKYSGNNVAESEITPSPKTPSTTEQTTQKLEENGGADAVGSSTDEAKLQTVLPPSPNRDPPAATEEDSKSPPAQDEQKQSVEVDSSTKCEKEQEQACKIADPLEIRAQDENDKSNTQKENGILEKSHSDGGIVDLGDDTDDDMVATSNTNTSPQSQQEQKSHLSGINADKNGNDSSITSTTNTTAKTPTTPSNTKTNSNSSGHNQSTVLSDSDGAVVIGSDSENEEISSRKPNSMNNSLTLPPPLAFSPQIQKAPVAAPISSRPQPIDDDDDDDCVVIEDTTPAPNSDLNKRKNQSVEELTGEDLQPPVKRLRSSIDLTNLNMDTRISVPEDLNIKKVNENIYPVTLSPSTNATQGPPKLVPMSSNMNAMGNSNMAPMPQVPSLGSNSTLLPGLTDDMFVLEAPSFIVPYIYEKPPGLNLNEVIRDIESKYSLSKEDLAEADKTDEFDMITEQNKTEKLEGDIKKKKKRRGGDDGDESWSEQSEEEEDDDDDDDSESGIKTKVLIKEASDDLTVLQGAIKPPAAVAQSTAVAPNGAAKPGQENYFESPLGKFFMDIGVGLVQEFVQSDLIRLQKRKMRKSLGKNTMEFERAITALSGNLEASKKRNAPFKFTMKRCEFCNFKSESALAMANHYETPHMNGPLYKCNFCIFEIRNATEIVYHMEAVHNIKARLIKPLPYHQCPNCGFEDNGKAKLARHQPVCAKKFRPELNLAPTNDWEAPAKIPRIKPRHGLVGTATAYQAMAAQAAAQKAALASIQQQQQVQQQQRTLQAAAIAAQTAANKMRGRAPIVPKPGPNAPGMLRPQHQAIRTPMASNVVLQNNYQMPGNQLLQNTANAMAKKANPGGQPSISITPLPRQAAAPAPAAASTSKVIPAGVKPGQSPGGNKAQFVICEICDGYIKDLEQLRNHMQWMHKVKIHPKMIYNRPPLNCQKCQFRFFTDQGLERHLLGSHGLVTSSMQEAANKGKDSGRCPVCGRMYQWKLLNHVSRDHHMTLKPAHLSYKCTVCTATFGMYKQFETHVYTAHSTVAKRAMDGKKTSVPGPSGSGGGSSSSSSSQRLSTNDSILKPLKINDEITIIPQPATKPRITNVESHVID